MSNYIKHYLDADYDIKFSGKTYNVKVWYAEHRETGEQGYYTRVTHQGDEVLVQTCTQTHIAPWDLEMML
jgi:hypothetical protein